MKFKSTRGSVAGVSFEEAVISGCAGDGGLFMPESFPSLSREQLRAWSKLTYPQLVEAFLRLYVDQEEMSDQEIRGMCSLMYVDVSCMHTSHTNTNIIKKMHTQTSRTHGCARMHINKFKSMQ